MSDLMYKPAAEMSWGELKQLIDSTEGVTDDSPIESIRVKGAYNAVYVESTDTGIIAHD